MRLKSKLVLAASMVTFGLVLLLGFLFLSELLRQRIAQTVDADTVLAKEVSLAASQALEEQIPARVEQLELEPALPPDQAFRAAVTDVLRTDPALRSVMLGILRYSPTIQEVSITDAVSGATLVSTDSDIPGQPPTPPTSPPLTRISLEHLNHGNIFYQATRLFGRPRILDITAPLDRNDKPFLVIHVGLRSTFLRASYAPWLRTAFFFALIAAGLSVLAAGLLSSLALRPLETINAQLELLSASVLGSPDDDLDTLPDPALTVRNALRNPLRITPLNLRRDTSDTIVRVTRNLNRLERSMRTSQAGYTALQANLNQMLDTLRDGVILFAADSRAVMVSDAVAHFLPARSTENLVGQTIADIFPPGTSLGNAVLAAFATGRSVSGQLVLLEDGRQVQISLDTIPTRLSPLVASLGAPAATSSDATTMGTLLTLRDTESAIQLEQELEVSRRLAAIGRITAGVGHEVKNPINAMVLHLELLRGKLAALVEGTHPYPDQPGHSYGSAAFTPAERLASATRHLDILSSEMQRLDRVVQTLADFSRPMDLHLRRYDLHPIVASVAELTSEQMREHHVRLLIEPPRESHPEPLWVHVDPDLIRQALLNLVLNAMQSMPEGGVVNICLRREAGGAPSPVHHAALSMQHPTHQFAVVEVRDHGTGIPAELLPRIFELYFTTKSSGTGIGLAMTYRILQLHGGALDVRSNADPDSQQRGSVFTLRLPITTPGISSPQVTARSGSQARAAAEISSGEQVERR